MLGEFGLSAATERVYRALLDDPAARRPQLAGRLGVPYAAVSQALRELTDLGLMRASRRDPEHRIPVAPEVAAALLVHAQEAELDRRRQTLRKARSAADALARAEAARWHDLPAGFEGLGDPDEVRGRGEAMSVAALSEFSMILTPAELAEGFGPLVGQTAQRCALRRVVGPEAMRDAPATAAYARMCVEASVQFRTAGDLPGSLLIIDRAVALAQADLLGVGLDTVMVTAPAVVDALCGVFDRVWAGATALDGAAAAEAEHDLCAADRALLKMMGDGLTDAAAAKRLGVSHSTAQRRVEGLMRRLDAGSRFQAGVIAHDRGWL